MRRTLIRGATTITMHPALGDLSRGDVLVEDGRITALAPSLAVEDADIVPAEGFIVIPGLIATLAGALNQLNCGTTKLVDWCHNNPTPAHTDAAITALRESGIRAAFFHGSPKPDPKPGERHFSEVPHPRQEVERLLAGPLAARDGLLSLGLAILGPHYSTLDVALHDFRLARDLGLVASMHQGGAQRSHRKAGTYSSARGWSATSSMSSMVTTCRTPGWRWRTSARWTTPQAASLATASRLPRPSLRARRCPGSLCRARGCYGYRTGSARWAGDAGGVGEHRLRDGGWRWLASGASATGGCLALT